SSVADFGGFKWLADSQEISPSMLQSKPPQPEKHLCRYESVAAGRVAIVWNHAECIAQRVQGEPSNGRPAKKRAGFFKMQSKIHGVERAVEQADSPVPVAGFVECCNVM